MPGKTPAAPRQYHKGNVAEDLKLATLRILEAERLEDLSVRRLAREVGVTPANFYNHFASLNDLLYEIGADFFRERARQMAHIRRTAKNRAEAMRRVTVSYLDLALARPQMFRLLFGALPDAQFHPAFRDASDESMAEIVEIVYGERLHDPAHLQNTRERCKAAYGLVALGTGLARHVVEGVVPFSSKQQAEMRRFFESVVDSFIAGELAELASR
jgi:AcrR family transcriptional regulator